jgi:hypothetical protein
MNSAWRRIGTMMTMIWVLVAAAPGCSDKPAVDTTTAEAKVTGKITIRGKPMNGGEITFNPQNYRRPDAPTKSAKINADGTYELSTLQGQNSVMITGPAITKEPALGYAALKFDIKSGDNPIDIELPPK